jgi:putative IMPACT (imprinted ancient) family translation regulator
MSEWIVQEMGQSFLEIKHSKFYSLCLSVPDIPMFQDSLVTAKNLHPEATHLIFAYRIREKGKTLLEKFTDGGEPSRTAGFPTLELLRHHNLINTALITLRLFGGVKLGKSNLLRAYLDSAQIAIQNATLELLEQKYLLRLSLTEPQYSLIMKHLKNKPGKEFHFQYIDGFYDFQLSLKESDLPDWQLFFDKHQFYTYDIMEQNNEGGDNEETRFAN